VSVTRLRGWLWPIAIIVFVLAVGIPRMIEGGYEEVGIWVSAFCTLAVFSFLYRENPIYRTAEHLMLGTSIGYNLGATITDILRPTWWIPTIEGFRTGDFGAIFFGVTALVFGLSWYGLFHPRTHWLSRTTMGLVMGAGAGLAIKQQFVLNVPQVTASFKPPIVLNDFGTVDPGASINNIIFLVALLLTINFFFFSLDHSRKVSERVQRLLDALPSWLRGPLAFLCMFFSGRFWLMLAFGVFFGNTVMTRLSVFIERVWFLVERWAVPVLTGAPP
jgi:hypothetical protein